MIFHHQFAKYLDQLYCAKSHLIERLSALEEHPDFEDIKSFIKKVCREAEQATQKLESIYSLIGLNYSFKQCKDLIRWVDTTYDNILKAQADTTDRNLALLYYVNVISSLECAALKNLNFLITASENDQIARLLMIYQNEIQANDHLSALGN